MKLNLKTTRNLTMSALFALALTACGQTNSMSPMQVRQPVRMQSQQVQTQATQTRQLIVRFRHEMNRAMANEFNAKYGLHILQFVPAIDAYIVEIDADLGLKAERVISYLKQDPMVMHAEVNVAVQLQPSPDLHTMPVYK